MVLKIFQSIIFIDIIKCNSAKSLLLHTWLLVWIVAKWTKYGLALNFFPQKGMKEKKHDRDILCTAISNFLLLK